MHLFLAHVHKKEGREKMVKAAQQSEIPKSLQGL
jgi:hypothetical protein